MTCLSDIADRHERAVAGLEDVARPLAVRIVVGGHLQDLAAQHVLACLCNLLCRMARVVSVIEIDAPEVPWRAAAGWRMAGRSVLGRMRSLSRWATGGLVPVRAPAATPADFTICIGSRPEAYGGRIDLAVAGAGWRAWAGAEAHVPALAAKDRAAGNPLGPYLAACLAAAEVFKRSRGLKRGRFAEDFGYSLWRGEQGAWRDLAGGPPFEGLTLPPFYLVGAGAVGQGLYGVIAASGVATAYVTTLDDDSHDDTNLNRNPLAGVKDLTRPKIDVIARVRRAAGLRGGEYKVTLARYVLRAARTGLPAEIAALEADDRYPVIVSAVDKNTSRQDIQGLRPDLVVGGSTLGLTAKANVYDMAPGAACLGCNNPAEDDGARLREVEQQVRGMPEAEQRACLEGRVEDVDAVVAYLRGADRCGQLGEAQFRDFATAQDPEFSVSFVSMTAAVLLASRLFARLLFPEAELPRRRMSSLNFRNLEVGDDDLCQEPQCRHCRAAGRLRVRA
jgi:hypothetical protein